MTLCISNVGVPEWLSGMTRNHVGFARAGSNPAAHVFVHSFFFFFVYFFFPPRIGFFLSIFIYLQKMSLNIYSIFSYQKLINK